MTANASRVLVLNSGSSSVKYQLLDMATAAAWPSAWSSASARRPRGWPTPRWPPTAPRASTAGPIADHEAALKAVAEELARDGLGLDSPRAGRDRPPGRARRARRSPRRPSSTTRCSPEIERLIPVAPLHNPANLTGIRTARALRPDLPQVAVFDTAFHTTMPEDAARYAIDVATADEHRIRRYGFHGTSHAYVSRGDRDAAGQGP